MHLHYLHLGRRRQSAFWDGMECKKCNALQGDEVQLDGSPLRQQRRGLLLPFQRRGRPGRLAQCSVLSAVDFRVTSTSAASHYQQTADCRLQTAWDGDGGE